MSPSDRNRAGGAAAIVLLCALALADLVPLLHMAKLAAWGPSAPGGTGGAVPGGPFLRLFASAPQFARWFLNSLAAATLSVAFHLAADSMAGYALAKRRFRGRGWILALVLLAMMIPRQVTLIPLFLGMSRNGMADSFAGLLLPGLGDVVGVFLIRQHLLTLPDSLLEAARIDGAGPWRVFWHVVLPLSKPALAVLGVLAFQHYWSDFFWPLVILHSEENYTLPVGLAYLSQSEFGPDLPLLAAGAAVAAAPALAVFLLFRGAFFEGQRGGAVK